MMIFGITCFSWNGSSVEPLGTTALCTMNAVVSTTAAGAAVVVTAVAVVASKDLSSSLVVEWRGLVPATTVTASST